MWKRILDRMMWVLVGSAVVVFVATIPLRRQMRQRAWEDRTRPGLPARRTQPRRGVGGLGEAPVTVHHRLGGRSSDD